MPSIQALRQRRQDAHNHFKEWAPQAACRGIDAKIFFDDDSPGRRKRSDGPRSALAKAICETCPVRLDCLEYALITSEPHGVWGGFTFTERKDVRRRWGQGSRERLSLIIEKTV